MTCPQCQQRVGPTDAYCEACGADLTGGAPTTGATDGHPPHDASGGPRTTQFLPAPEPLPDVARACAMCGGDVDDDGFCTVCGSRARTPRDHWTETPSTWVGGVCDKGITHARNEDAMALSSTAERGRAVLVVCDGVTSAPESDRASIAAARAACALVSAAAPPGTDSFAGRLTHWERRLTDACRDANAEAVGVAKRLGDPPEPPSCTFVAAVVEPDLVSVAWCGDSRGYWLPDGGGGRQLGVDHSIGAELIAQGTSPRDAARDPRFHTITRWLGADSYDPTPECVSARLDAPGWVMVCSDGLWNYASDPAELHELILTAQRDGAIGPTAVAESLAAWANDQGGHDNITVALARIDPRVP